MRRTKFKNILQLFTIITLSLAFIINCGIGEGGGSAVSYPGTTASASTAPGLKTEVQQAYRSSAARSTKSIQLREDDLGSEGVTKYNNRVTKNSETGQQLDLSDYSSFPMYNANATYAEPTLVRYQDSNSKHGVFRNSWWSKGTTPSFLGGGPWVVMSRTDSNWAAIPTPIEEWTPAQNNYSSDEIVVYNSNCYKAKWWAGSSAEPGTNQYGPWYELSTCPANQEKKSDGVDSLLDTITPREAVSLDQSDDGNLESPVVPPVIPAPVTPIELPSTPPSPPEDTDEESNSSDQITVSLPSSGYEFLKQLTFEHWNFLFPFRSGNYTTKGGSRNLPPIADASGKNSKDAFNLNNFRKAVLEYNTWAAKHKYKQFLNQGSTKGQATEFVAFFAKTNQETGGTWAGAPAPWITDIVSKSSGTSLSKLWAGNLYWIEEVGYIGTTNSDGTSSIVGYVDQGSQYTPAPNRSYHGRGIIQLSWNYNYGGFSEWLFTNGMFPNIIKRADTLLWYPNLVSENGALSMLSGIWFWMTPQGAKPSSQDVILGLETRLSKTTNDTGFPKLIDNTHGPVANGDTNDDAVMAYRVGTIIDIVNGGIECNKQSSWHPGPPRRAAGYSAYALYFNDVLLNGADEINVIDDAINIWSTKVTNSSPLTVRYATCYQLKAYYGW